MVLHSTTRWLAVTAGLVLASPAVAAQAHQGGPAARAAGGDAPPISPSIVAVPIQRTDSALSNAAEAIDAGQGAQAATALNASRRYLIRSYSGAKYLIAHMPPPAAEEARVQRRFVRLARRAVRANHARAAHKGSWITAHSADGPTGPVIADAPTAVFSVLTSQYDAATAAVGMAPDTKGQLLAKVKTALDTAIVLRNRLVKVVHAASPAPVAEEGRVRAHASQEEGAATFDTVMPGLTVLLDDELQQMNAASDDASTPADAKAVLTDAIAADTQIKNLVNQYWPPVVGD